MINFQSIPKSQFDLVCRLIRPDQAISLILADDRETPCQSQLFLSSFRIEKFTRLRSLKLIELIDDGQRLLSKLYKVSSLVSLEIDIRIDPPSIKSLPPVRNLIINLPSGVQFDIRRSVGGLSLEHVRHLSISYCSIGAFLHFFNKMPQLKSFQSSLLFLKPIEVYMMAYIHQIQTTPIGLTFLALTINAPGQELTNNHFELFLAPFQQLKHLELIIETYLDHEFLNANQWENFIIQNLPKLTTFDFKFRASFIEREIIDRFRSPFWLNKCWFVAFDQSLQSLFTVPHFIAMATTNSIKPISPEWTTLPIEQHIRFYDRVTLLTYESDSLELEYPYRYNYIKRLIFDDPYMYDNRIDLSKVELLFINTSDWPLNKILLLIKESMPSVNHLRLNCTEENLQEKHFLDISLPQIEKLCLPTFGRCKGYAQFNWSKVFPCVKRLTASINSKRQIPYLIDHFKKINNAFFVMDEYHFDTFDQIKITRQWLKNQSYRLKSKKENNFVCKINDKYSFSLSLYMNDSD